MLWIVRQKVIQCFHAIIIKGESGEKGPFPLLHTPLLTNSKHSEANKAKGSNFNGHNCSAGQMVSQHAHQKIMTQWLVQCNNHRKKNKPNTKGFQEMSSEGILAKSILWHLQRWQVAVECMQFNLGLWTEWTDCSAMWCGARSELVELDILPLTSVWEGFLPHHCVNLYYWQEPVRDVTVYLR